MSASDWATVANLATALGTLALAVARFTMLPRGEDPDGGWLASQSRHWNIDRPDPR